MCVAPKQGTSSLATILGTRSSSIRLEIRFSGAGNRSGGFVRPTMAEASVAGSADAPAPGKPSSARTSAERTSDGTYRRDRIIALIIDGETVHLEGNEHVERWDRPSTEHGEILIGAIDCKGIPMVKPNGAEKVVRRTKGMRSTTRRRRRRWPPSPPCSATHPGCAALPMSSAASSATPPLQG